MQIIFKKHSSEKEIKRFNNKNEKMFNLTACQRCENENSNEILIRLTVDEIVGILTHTCDTDGSIK